MTSVSTALASGFDGAGAVLEEDDFSFFVFGFTALRGFFTVFCFPAGFLRIIAPVKVAEFGGDLLLRGKYFANTVA
jgi:hypothetical protein